MGEQRARNQQVSKAGATGSNNNEEIFIRSNRQLPPAVSLVNTATMQTEQRTLGFKWCLSRHVHILSFSFLYSLLHQKEAINLQVFFFFFLHKGWSHSWAGGQTSITDENMRLSGGPLKEDCWGGPETSMSCPWARACVQWSRGRRRQVM